MKLVCSYICMYMSDPVTSKFSLSNMNCWTHSFNTKCIDYSVSKNLALWLMCVYIVYVVCVYPRFVTDLL